MTAKENRGTIEECVRFCKFCEEKWKKGEHKEFNVEVAIAACSICESFVCEEHSFFWRGKCRCRDQRKCHPIVPDRDEGGGD